MPKQPKNSDLGAERSRKIRSLGRAANSDRIWELLHIIASTFKPKTLQEYANVLNDAKVPLASGKGKWDENSDGKRWTTNTVMPFLKNRGYTAKSFTAIWDRPPSPYVPKAFPVEIFDKYRDFILKTSLITPENGDWLSASDHVLKKGMNILHAEHGHGVISDVNKFPFIECRFSWIENGYWDGYQKSIPLIQLSVWKPIRTAQEIYDLQIAFWKKLTAGQKMVEYNKDESPYLPKEWRAENRSRK